MCLITQLVYNPSRRLEKPDQLFDENNEGMILVVQEAAREAMHSGGNVPILRYGSCNWFDHGSENTGRFKFLQCYRRTVCTNTSQRSIRLEGRMLHHNWILTHSSLAIVNITYGPPLGKSNQLVLQMDYRRKEKMLKDKEHNVMTLGAV